jgi:Family of unknown function (DUF5767)
MEGDDIILERGETSRIMKLDDDEQALLNEFEIQPPPPPRPVFKKAKKPAVQFATPAPQDEIEAFTNPVKRTAPPRPPPEVVDYGVDDGDDYGGGGGVDGGYEEQQEQYASQEDLPSAGYTTIEDEKADILNKLSRLEKKGLTVNKRLNIYSGIHELRTELKRVLYGIEVDQSIKFSRRMLIACVTGVEFLNKRYNPFDIQLEGWSENVMGNVDDYDGVFEELYAKYKSKVAVAPEIKLIMMVGGSAMMFHLTNSMFKSAMPNMNDVLKQNPDLLKNMMSAVQNTQRRPDQEDPTARPTQSGGRREMSGPGLDISSLMGGIMMPPMPPMNTKPMIIEEDTESLSDIVSVTGHSVEGDVKDVNLSKTKRGRGRPSKKKTTEVSI